ncbi:hypothetical protein D3C76_1449590 [compost metagenome]
MAAHGLKCPRPEVVFQAGAGLTPTGGFENRLANPKASTLEAEQVDPTDNEIAPQIFRLERFIVRTPHQRTDHRQVLPLHQRHLPRIAHTGAGMIASQSGLQSCLNGIQFDHLRA